MRGLDPISNQGTATGKERGRMLPRLCAVLPRRCYCILQHSLTPVLVRLLVSAAQLSDRVVVSYFVRSPSALRTAMVRITPVLEIVGYLYTLVRGLAYLSEF